MIRFIFKTIFFFIFSAVLVVGLLVFFIWSKNPYNVRNCLVSNYLAEKIQDTKSGKIATTTSDKKPEEIFQFSDQQKSALEKAGLDAAKIPVQTIINKEDCFKQKIGEDRVKEIKAGAVPSAFEIFRSKDCF